MLQIGLGFPRARRCRSALPVATTSPRSCGKTDHIHDRVVRRAVPRRRCGRPEPARTRNASRSNGSLADFISHWLDKRMAVKSASAQSVIQHPCSSSTGRSVRHLQAPPGRRAFDHPGPATHCQTAYPWAAFDYDGVPRTNCPSRVLYCVPRHRVFTRQSCVTSPPQAAGWNVLGHHRLAIRDRANRVHPLDAHRGRDRRRRRAAAAAGDWFSLSHPGHLCHRRPRHRCAAGPQMAPAVYVASRPPDGIGAASPPRIDTMLVYGRFRSPVPGYAMSGNGMSILPADAANRSSRRDGDTRGGSTADRTAGLRFTGSLAWHRRRAHKTNQDSLCLVVTVWRPG